MAVAMAVALPDMCVSLSSANGNSTGALYKKWCEENLGPEFDYLTPDDLWSIRCGVLHNGRFGDRHKKSDVGRIIFIPPGSPFVMTNCVVNDAYIYSVTSFCQNFTKAVFNWFEKHRDDPNVVSNMPKFMQYRENGMAPYVVGAVVLA